MENNIAIVAVLLISVGFVFETGPEMVNLYKSPCEELEWEIDQGLLQTMWAKKREEIKQRDEK